MRSRVSISIVVTLAIAVFGVQRASASHDFNQTGAGTYDSNNGGNWNNGVPTGDGQDVNFTQTPTGAQIVTNFFSSGGGNLNYVRLATGGGNSLIVVSTA